MRGAAGPRAGDCARRPPTSRRATSPAVAVYAVASAAAHAARRCRDGALLCRALALVEAAVARVPAAACPLAAAHLGAFAVASVAAAVALGWLAGGAELLWVDAAVAAGLAAVGGESSVRRALHAVIEHAIGDDNGGDDGGSDVSDVSGAALTGTCYVVIGCGGGTGLGR